MRVSAASAFATVDPYPGRLHPGDRQAVGRRRPGADGDAAPASVAVALGPQYGTVGPSFIKSAAREALRADGVDLLTVLGFAFDPQALGTDEEYVSSDEGFDGVGFSVGGERNLGRLPVLLVRMNNDLVMGDDLKKTGAGNLFTVFGEPDVDIRTVDGADVYDPSTGEVRSRDRFPPPEPPAHRRDSPNLASEP